MELEFEFVQPDEFSDPYYHIYDESCNGGYEYHPIGSIEYYAGYGYMFISYNSAINSIILDSVARKIKELNESLKQQRILGVF